MFTPANSVDWATLCQPACNTDFLVSLCLGLSGCPLLILTAAPSSSRAATTGSPMEREARERTTAQPYWSVVAHVVLYCPLSRGVLPRHLSRSFFLAFSDFSLLFFSSDSRPWLLACPPPRPPLASGLPALCTPSRCPPDSHVDWLPCPSPPSGLFARPRQLAFFSRRSTHSGRTVPPGARHLGVYSNLFVATVALPVRSFFFLRVELRLTVFPPPAPLLRCALRGFFSFFPPGCVSSSLGSCLLRYVCLLACSCIYLLIHSSPHALPLFLFCLSPMTFSPTIIELLFAGWLSPASCSLFGVSLSFCISGFSSHEMAY